ncbi:hypothetical protein GCM10010234_10110 [Streptomyces hawaiiensis]
MPAAGAVGCDSALQVAASAMQLATKRTREGAMFGAERPSILVGTSAPSLRHQVNVLTTLCK